MKEPEEIYFEMATANTKQTRPNVCVDECLALMRDFAKEQIILLAIHDVINWVATKDQKPVNKQMVLTYDKRLGITYCGYQSPHWEYVKPKYWASTENLKPPCL